MKKLFAVISAFIAFGVIFMGAGAVEAISFDYINSETIGMDSNTSFFAPTLNISMPLSMLPHEIWIGTQEFFVMVED